VSRVSLPFDKAHDPVQLAAQLRAANLDATVSDEGSNRFWVNVSADDAAAVAAVVDAHNSSPRYEVPTGDIDGENDTFSFSAPPILVFRNGTMERALGTIDGSNFVFDSAPDEGDVIEGLL